MIDLSIKNYFKNIFFTLNFYHLKLVGTFEFIVLDKRVKASRSSESETFFIYLSTKDKEYSSTIVVSQDNFNKAKVNRPYGMCSVVKNIKHPEFIFITEDTNPGTAIKKTVIKSWGKLLFFLLALALCCQLPILIIYYFILS